MESYKHSYPPHKHLIKYFIHAASNENLLAYGEIEGEVRSPYVVINGIVNGDVHGSRHVELLSNAKIKGNVYYNLVELAVGAEVNGKLVHTPAKPEEEVGLELNYNEVSE